MHFGIRLWLLSGAICLVMVTSLSAFDSRVRDTAIALVHAADAVFAGEFTALALAPPTAGATPFTPAPPPPPPTYSRDELCSRAALVAAERNLPVPFFANLIWQESGFRTHVISPAGARGIAQFMPQTGQAYGLDNPFDPIPALSASGRLLSDLVAQFGNVGLAAAAYNAGPKRVSDWMNKRASLPRETRNYVQRITGRSAEQWASPRFDVTRHRMPRYAPCLEVAMALEAQAKAEHAQAMAARELAAAASPVKRPFALAAIPGRTEARVPQRFRMALASAKLSAAKARPQPAAAAKVTARRFYPAVRMVRRFAHPVRTAHRPAVIRKMNVAAAR